MAGLSPQSALPIAMRFCNRTDGNMAAPGTAVQLPPPGAQEWTPGKRISTRRGLPVHTTAQDHSVRVSTMQTKFCTKRRVRRDAPRRHLVRHDAPYVLYMIVGSQHRRAASASLPVRQFGEGRRKPQGPRDENKRFDHHDTTNTTKCRAAKKSNVLAAITSFLFFRGLRGVAAVLIAPNRTTDCTSV